jgi:hypothetical protein
MDQRVEVSAAELGAALKMVGDGLTRRLTDKGRMCLIGPHEIYGIAAEEFNHELLGALHGNDRPRFTEELVDVAVTCVFGLASLMARTRTEGPGK